MKRLDPTTLTKLYAAAAGDEPLEAPIREIQNCLDSNIAAVWLRSPTDLEVTRPLLTTNLDPRCVDEYVDEYAAIDPTAAGAATTQPGSAFTSDDLIERKQLERTRFFNDWMFGTESAQFLGSWGLLSNGLMAAVSFQRAPGKEAFGSREKRWLERVMPHLLGCLDVRARLAGLGPLDERPLTQLVDNLGRPAFVVDVRSKILCANDAALAVADAGLVRVRAGRLALPSVQPRRWEALLHAGSGVVRLGMRGKHEPVVGRLLALRLPGSAGLYLFEVTYPHLRRFQRQMATEQFGLTPTETVVAEALASGSSVQQLTQLLKTKDSTVRTHLKALFAKTETSRQGELVAVLSRFLIQTDS